MPYAHCQPRRKGQRYDKPLLPTFCTTGPQGGALIQHGSPAPVGTAAVVGIFTGYDPFGGECQYEELECTLPCGTIVPAYRKHSAESNYMVCQRFTYKAVTKPQ